jgi:hypothetical protein
MGGSLSYTWLPPAAIIPTPTITITVRAVLVVQN